MSTTFYFLAVFFCYPNFVFLQSSFEHPPFFLKTSPKLIVVKDNETVTLECEAAGDPAVKYSWKKNGATLDLNGPNIRVEKENRTVKISGQSVEGSYQCLAENKNGLAFSNLTQVRLALLQPVGPTLVTKELTAVEGRPFTIPGSDFHSFPRSRSSDDFIWMKYAVGQMNIDPERIYPGERIQIDDNGDLHFAFVQTTDDLSGKLYANALNNSHLGRATDGNYTRLIVQRNSDAVKNFAPSLTTSSVSASPVLVGDNVTLRCIFAGKPEPAVTWVRSGSELPADRFILTQHDTALTLVNVIHSDETSYECIGTNELGSTEYTLSLPVQARPRFLDWSRDSPQHLDVVEKDSVTFQCNSSAIPEAEVVWFYNGKSLKDFPRQRFAISADRKSLTVSSVCRQCKGQDGGQEVNVSDTGVIQCNASNIHGYSIGTGYLNVVTMRQAEARSGGTVSFVANILFFIFPIFNSISISKDS